MEGLPVYQDDEGKENCENLNSEDLEVVYKSLNYFVTLMEIDYYNTTDPVQKIIDVGTVPKVITLLHNSPDNLTHLACRFFIQMLCIHPEHINIIADYGVLIPLIRLVEKSSDNSMLVGIALWIIGSIAEDPKYREELYENGPLQTFLSLLQKSNASFTIGSVSLIVKNLCQGDVSVEKGFKLLEILSLVMKSNNSLSLSNGASALKEISKLKEMIFYLIEWSLVKLSLDVLKNEVYSRFYADLLLIIENTSKENPQHVFSIGTSSVILRFLFGPINPEPAPDGEDEVDPTNTTEAKRLIVLNILSNLIPSANTDQIQEFIDLHYFETLINLLNNDTDSKKVINLLFLLLKNEDVTFDQMEFLVSHFEFLQVFIIQLEAPNLSSQDKITIIKSINHILSIGDQIQLQKKAENNSFVANFTSIDGFSRLKTIYETDNTIETHYPLSNILNFEK
ncbi:hypothetical protein CYY_003958 [Polysphondylium violaceum]|uniref:Armadillo repeat-containing protein n=1 Tax=Polysphondylium violaceum TaxID=133409 RepID=A0A8J4Q663_9MYCE|nr:hypothetical protein CYY_003958 [Polysphondylium violaceum]